MDLSCVIVTRLQAQSSKWEAKSKGHFSRTQISASTSGTDVRVEQRIQRGVPAECAIRTILGGVAKKKNPTRRGPVMMRTAGLEQLVSVPFRLTMLVVPHALVCCTNASVATV